ncbi:PilX N-terminal domain-containing pilus assembly protein [Pseudoduganella sp. RAF19]|uniref:pilus assembly PilX family protein n=1 Tax=Pseudoduganella sp. RAF19 TaxID=3233052 RepID=UPI003F965B19
MMRRRERGVALLVTLLLLVAVLLLGASASTMALLSEKSARAERDRLIAFQAAEDGLMDAERDIETARVSVVPAATETPPAAQPRATPVGALGAGPGDAAPYSAPPAATGGEPAPSGAAPAWQVVDLAGGDSVPFGALSGAGMETGQGMQPFKRPRYFAERLARAGGGFYYRVTVMGFGTRPDSEVVLQTTYRRIADGGAGRQSWREIANWRELHAAAHGEDKP